MIANLAALILTVLMALVPPGRVHAFPGWQESPEAIAARYASIADDIAFASRASSPGEELSNAALLLGVGLHESAFGADVDAGDCYRGGTMKKRCDSGRAVSDWQLQDKDREKRELYRTNRRAAAQEALRRIRTSLMLCRKSPAGERLASYATGHGCEEGLDVARELASFVNRARNLLARAFLAASKPPVSSATIGGGEQARR